MNVTWLPLPTPFPELKLWGCYRGRFQYVLGYNGVLKLWGATVKPSGVKEAFTQLGWQHPSREAAEAAMEQHYRGTLQ